MMLSEEQLAHFRSKGYVVVDNLLDADTISEVQQEYAQLMDKLYEDWFTRGLTSTPPDGLSFFEKLDECFRKGFEWYQPFDITLPHTDIGESTPMHCGPAVFNMLTSPRVLDAVEDLIGPEITSNPIQHVRIKPPSNLIPAAETRAHITATSWHQDMGVTLPEADTTKFVTVWLAITDATVENGCLQMARKSYDTLLPHCPGKQVGIASQFLPDGEPVPVSAGSAVIFNPFTPHASLPNNSDAYRWSFDLRYNVTGQASGRSQFPEFVARSRANPASVLRDWTVWKKKWHATRSMLAASEHIPQHRWGADAPYCA
eukprot:m.1639557 g.1639557  ORF g.1639557 m.1639557 type:complete len:315 (+) comp36483_c0_seq1:221-1165(+)